MIYLYLFMPVPCLHAGLFIYLSISISCAMDVCATPSYRHVGVVVWSFVKLWFLRVVCGSCHFGSGLQAGRGIVIRLIISIVGTSLRDRNVERNSFPCV
jgi:hypothetical protein